MEREFLCAKVDRRSPRVHCRRDLTKQSAVGKGNLMDHWVFISRDPEVCDG